MFSIDTYVSRRKRLKETVGGGLLLLPGNNEAPCNYTANTYYPFRQDSSFLYYFGLQRDALTGVIDIDEDKETLFGDDISLDDIVWYGSTTSVKEMASLSGVAHSAPMKDLKKVVDKALSEKRRIHYLPPYRYDTMIMLMDLLGVHPSRQKAGASLPFIKAVVKQRSKKEPQEIAEIEKACAIGYRMHTTAMRLVKPGVTEKYVAGQIDGQALSYGAQNSFPTIFSQHGEIQHGSPSMRPLEAGRIAVCDCGAETTEHYCSDNTRTIPVSGRFSLRQREIYSIVEACHDHVLEIARPGVKYQDVHFSICRMMTERLKALGLMRGDTDEAVLAGAHAMFMVHGLGHMMGMDVHDMEGLGQIYVGFDDEVRPRLDQFGTNCLRMGRRLEEGFVVTDEPGIYFIPALIDDWRSKGHCGEFLNFDKIEEYKDFGGIRIEDDVLITRDSCRFLGEKRIPYHPDDVEAFMNNNQ